MSVDIRLSTERRLGKYHMTEAYKGDSACKRNTGKNETVVHIIYEWTVLERIQLELFWKLSEKLELIR